MFLLAVVFFAIIQINCKMQCSVHHDHVRHHKIWKSDFSETIMIIKWNYWCECELMQSSTSYNRLFTQYSHEYCSHLQIILFGDQQFLVRMKFGVCFRQTHHLFQTICSVCFEHSRAANYVLKTLRSFWTHCCIRFEHITAFVSNTCVRQ